MSAFSPCSVHVDIEINSTLLGAVIAVFPLVLRETHLPWKRKLYKCRCRIRDGWLQNQITWLCAFCLVQWLTDLGASASVAVNTLWVFVYTSGCDIGTAPLAPDWPPLESRESPSFPMMSFAGRQKRSPRMCRAGERWDQIRRMLILYVQPGTRVTHGVLSKRLGDGSGGGQEAADPHLGSVNENSVKYFRPIWNASFRLWHFCRKISTCTERLKYI